MLVAGIHPCKWVHDMARAQIKLPHPVSESLIVINFVYNDNTPSPVQYSLRTVREELPDCGHLRGAKQDVRKSSKLLVLLHFSQLYLYFSFRCFALSHSHLGLAAFTRVLRKPYSIKL